MRATVKRLLRKYGYPPDKQESATVLVLQQAELIVESVFGWPGLGTLIFDALSNKDEPLVMASVVMLVLMLVIGSLIADVLLAIIDPRIRLE